MTDELKPCPFCGGEVKLKTDDVGGYSIECGNHEWPKNRFMQGIPNQTIAADVLMCSWGQGEDAKQALIEAWNTRTERTCHETKVDEYFHGCDSCGYVWEAFYNFGKRKRPKYCPNCGAKVIA